VPRFHFRLRTIMIVVAGLAALMGIIRILALQAGVSGVALGYFGSTPCILIDVVPERPHGPAIGAQILFWKTTYAIPLRNLVVLAVPATAVFALSVFYRRNRRRGRPRAPFHNKL